MGETVTYSAYGIARHHRMGDVDGDGDVDITGGTNDRGIVSAIAGQTLANRSIGGSAYRSEADLDRNGVVNTSDRNLIPSAIAARPLGQLSDIASTGPDNQIGWDGYVFNAESGLYTVRFRSYAPGLGRWMEADPVGYADGVALYSYSRLNPARFLDPFGLKSILIRFDDDAPRGFDRKAVCDRLQEVLDACGFSERIHVICTGNDPKSPRNDLGWQYSEYTWCGVAAAPRLVPLLWYRDLYVACTREAVSYTHRVRWSSATRRGKAYVYGYASTDSDSISVCDGDRIDEETDGESTQLLSKEDRLALYANVLAHEVFWLGACDQFDRRSSPKGDIEAPGQTYGQGRRCGVTSRFCRELADAFGIHHDESIRSANEAQCPCRYGGS